MKIKLFTLIAILVFVLQSNSQEASATNNKKKSVAELKEELNTLDKEINIGEIELEFLKKDGFNFSLELKDKSNIIVNSFPKEIIIDKNEKDKFYTEVKILSLNKIEPAKIYTINILFTNPTDSKIKIQNSLTTCGCVVPKPPDVIDPWSTQLGAIKINTQGRKKGKFIKSVDIHTTGANNKKILYQFIVVAEVE
ncbi:MAG: DUF1573 domain-containing protein [Ignavibacteriae bacterium]|nr:DUF1573 domain-containing protein [Ignavibacteriota bacterium]